MKQGGIRNDGSVSRSVRRAAFGLAALTLACSFVSSQKHQSTDSAAESVARAPAAAALSVVLLTLDGVRFQEVFDGADLALATAQGVPTAHCKRAEQLMPNLHSWLATRGAAIGAPGTSSSMHASGPNFVSLPGYAEIFSGRRAPGCADNGCKQVERSTLLDELVALRARSGDVAAITSWPEIARVITNNPGEVTISAGRRHSSQRENFERNPSTRTLLSEAKNAAPYPGHGDFRPDRHTARLALEYLRSERPRFLFIGLGEPGRVCTPQRLPRIPECARKR